MASNARVRPLWVKLRNTRNEQIFSALPPITDILGGRLARLSSDGRECFHSQYSANPLGERPARALQTDKVLRSLLAGWKLDSFVLNRCRHEIPFAYERPLCAQRGPSL